MKRIIAPLAAVLLVVFMFFAASATFGEEIIFPEIATLIIAAWLIENSPLADKPLYLWLSPTLAAITGVGILHFLPYNPEILITFTFILVGLQLYLLRSNVLPSISAGILPIFLNFDSLYYPLSVFIFSGCIVAGRDLLTRFHFSGYSPIRLTSNLNIEERKPWETMKTSHWLMLFIGVIFVLIIAFKSKFIYIISPPLIVTFIEFSNPCGQVCQKPLRLLLLLLLASISGILWVEVTHFLLNWPLWVTAACIVIWIFFLFRRMQFVFPPAAAISLLPTIIPREMLLLYPLQVAIGVVIFIVIGKIIIAINLKSTDIGSGMTGGLNRRSMK
ncbi:MAG: hypothetical protein PHH85_00145 [Candidatus Methanoperedens sp.]|nr:hypothetical protein [Candidatus Methanoperedens sp.]